MQCPACDHEAAQEQFGNPMCCPSCGAFYAKALAARQRRDNPELAAPARPVKVKKGRALRWGVLSLLVLMGGYFFASPYIAVYQIRQAAKDRDADALEQHIDFPSVRESVKAQINVKVMESAKTELADNPFAALGVAFAGAMVDGMVNAMVTPAGLAQMMKGDKPKLKDQPRTSQGSNEPAPAAREPFEGAEMSYQGFNRFVVSVPDKTGDGQVRFILTRSGLSWLLSDVKLPL